jgi:hypothetical protein
MSNSLDDQSGLFFGDSLRSIIRKEIEDTGRKLLEAFKKNSASDFETFLALDSVQLQKLWSANLKELQGLRGTYI